MIHVHDGALPVGMLERLRTALARMPYTYGWKSATGKDWPGHWNAKILNADEQNTEDQSGVLSGFTEPWIVFRDYWEWTAGRWFNSAPSLLRYYSNASTYGVGGFPHTDSKRDGEQTVLLYMTPEWKREWAGATAIWDEAGKEVERAIMPAPGRIIIFPGTRLHAAWEVSRICHVARTVLVLKVRHDEPSPAA